MRKIAPPCQHRATGRRLPPLVYALGFVSLLTDVATEMIVPVLPLFLTGTLGASAAFVGLIEGLADSVAAVFKGLGGAWSDRGGSRKGWLIGGYGLSSVARPFIALASGPWWVLSLRVVDRVGKGVRTAPRDALLTAAVPAANRGWAFGLHRAMDHTGALLGGLLAAGLLYLGWSERAVIAWAAVPGGLAVTALLLLVKEPASETGATGASRIPNAAPPRFLWRNLPLPLRRYIVIAGAFALANSSDAFLLLKARETGFSPAELPLLWAWIHITRIGANLVGGRASDRLGPIRVVAAGWIIYAIIYGMVALAGEPWQIWVVLGLYGIYSGLTDGGEKAIVAALAPAATRGGAFGAFHCITGLAALPASALTGLLWHYQSSSFALLTSSVVAAVSGIWLIGARRIRSALELATET